MLRPAYRGVIADNVQDIHSHNLAHLNGVSAEDRLAHDRGPGVRLNLLWHP